MMQKGHVEELINLMYDLYIYIYILFRIFNIFIIINSNS